MSVYYLWNTALISGFVAAVVSGLEPVLFIAAFTGGMVIGACTRDEPELAKGVFAELIRATGLTVKGVERADPPAGSKRT